MAKLKVYGSNSFVTGRQRRCFAAVTSQKQFAGLTDTSVGYVAAYGAITGNTREVEMAMGKPGVLFTYMDESRGRPDDEIVEWDDNKRRK